MTGAAEFLLRPGLWPLLLAAPAAWAVFRVLDGGRERRRAEAAGPRGPGLEAGAPRRAAAGRALFAAGLLLAAVALLEPVFGEGGSSPEPRGADIVLALDVSRSMEAREGGRSRLERARGEIASLSERAAGDRLALVLFAGEAKVAVPLTADGGGLARVAAEAEPSSVGRGGTDLGAALEAALGALGGGRREGEGGDAAFVVLLTDGEDLEGRGLRAAEACGRAGVTVHGLGFGSPRGAKIPLGPGGPAGHGFRRDREGRDIVTSMDPSGLRALAAAAGGVFVDGGAAEGALPALYEQRILPAARARFAEGERRSRVPRFPWPLGGALLLWTVELCWFDPRRS